MSHPAPSTPDDRVDPARSFQHYEILRREDGTAWELGRGTMGITYKAFDVNLCCEVALKVVNAALLDAPNARERFVREARAAAALRHRNVASVYHLGNDGERFFYAMEFIDGETLDALVRRQGPLPVETALRVMEQTARALAAAERQGLVHRDIKPANIMVTHEDADDHMVVKVIDFGLARPVAGEGTSQGALTAGGFVGTPQFASPEQLEEHALDVRSDIYSLGVTSWFLLTGKAPFAGSLATICQQHLAAPPPWERLPDGLPTPVKRVLAHMLEKDPANRPQNAVLLRREIEACLEDLRAQPASARPTVVPASAASGVGNQRGSVKRPPEAGAMVSGRYELIRPVGESPRGRVFEARDTQAAGCTVAVTFLSAALFPAPTDLDHLSDEVRRVQAAAHPHLTQVFAFERAAGGKETVLVEEWMNGGTLVDLLAARGRSLTVGEVLRLLGQAAAAADFAASRRLEHLDLAIHQVYLHFNGSGVVDARQYLPTAMNDWPSWALKIHPLGTVGAHPEMNTWAGEVTRVPGVGSFETGGGGNGVPGALSGNYLHALAASTYELLGGAPDSWRRASGPGGNYASLPSLNEEANAILRQTLSKNSVFRRSRSFYEALARAAGFDPVSLQIATVVGPRAGSSVHLPTVPQARKDDPRRQPVAQVRPSEPASSSFSTEANTAFGFSADADTYPEGSISDRLTMVSGDPSPLGRWFLVTLALAAVFVLAVAGVWILLAQRLPREATPPTATGKPPSAILSTSETHRRAAGTPRPVIPPPLPRDAAHPPSPTLAPAASPDPVARVVPTPAIPAATASTILPDTLSADPAPTALPREKLVSVRVKSVPSGAEIFSAGRRLGTTPFEIELPAGTHELVAHYTGWPETRETVILGDDQSRASTEIHLMPPGLVPVGEELIPPAQGNHPHRVSSSPTHAPTPERRMVPVAPAIPVEPSADDPSLATHPAATARPEPEVRRALPPLTPFDPDGSLGTHDAAPAGD